jgi:uridine kinase
MVSSRRGRLLADIAAGILEISDRDVVCVAVDGVDGAGKTVFADELADVLGASGRVVIRASVDSFHNPRSVRYRLGRDSPRGFFEDSYDYPTLVRLLLAPLSDGGDRRIRRAAFDHRRDAPVEAPEEEAPIGALLIFDGIFLHREELRRYWHYSVFLDVPFRVSIPRGAQRGEGSADPQAASNRRYVEGQSIYLKTCRPWERATVVVSNEDLEAPFIVHDRRPPGRLDEA